LLRLQDGIHVLRTSLRDSNMTKIALSVYEPNPEPPEAEASLHVFVQPYIKIGTLFSNHLHIDDATVSRMHATIMEESGQIWIVDLGSNAGTLVNGKKINRHALKRGDEIQLGATRIVVEECSWGTGQ